MIVLTASEAAGNFVAYILASADEACGQCEEGEGKTKSSQFLSPWRPS